MSEFPLPGTIGLVPVSGQVGRLIRIGQWLAEEPFDRWLAQISEPNYQHAFMYLGDGKLIEAEPGGAVISQVTKYSSIYWCTGIASRFTGEQLAAAADMAHTFEGIPYSFLNYFALAAHRLDIHLPLLRQYIASTGHLICSALADASYRRAGLQIFSDDRWSGYVMPMDLYLRDRAIRREAGLRGLTG